VENDPVILEGSIKLFWLNKFKKNDLKWKLIGNAWCPLETLESQGKSLPEKFLLPGGQGHHHCHTNHFQQFNFIMSHFEVHLVTQDPELGPYI